MNVAAWLLPSQRTGNDFSFGVTDITETPVVPQTAELAELLADSYWGSGYLEGLAARYGFDEVRQRYLLARSGPNVAVRRGDFGEAVTVAYLREVEGYTVPVLKLRFKIGANQTLPGTDCVSFKVSEDSLLEVAFVESKLRTSLDLSVAVQGCSQLKRDADNDVPEMLTFIARRLRDTDHPLTNLVEQYVFERNTDLDKYLLVIVHETDNWDERILENLEDEDMGLAPLHVYVAQLSDLKNLADGAFSAMGAEVIEDDC